MAKTKMQKGRSLQLVFSYSGDVALKANVMDEAWLWYKRLGHMHFQGMKILENDNMVNGVPRIENKDGVS